MPAPSLKELTLGRIAQPVFFKKLKTIGKCPYDVIEPVLRQMSFHQLLVLEENTPRLRHDTQPLWKMHTLKVFPTVADTHDIEAADVEDADWRLLFHELQEERREREEIARSKLKANYNQIASGKSDRKIQVIRKSVPGKGQTRAGIGKPAMAQTIRKSSSIMGKALKASINSSLQSPQRNIPSSMLSQHIRPNPNARSMTTSTVQSTRREPTQATAKSKFLVPVRKR